MAARDRAGRRVFAGGGDTELEDATGTGFFAPAEVEGPAVPTASTGLPFAAVGAVTVVFPSFVTDNSSISESSSDESITITSL